MTNDLVEAGLNKQVSSPDVGGSEIVIRKACVADFDAVLAMLMHMVSDNPVGYRQDWAESGDVHSVINFHLEKGWALIAEHNSRVIGHLGWRIEYTRPPQIAMRFSEIESIYVEPQYRNRDIAQKLGQAHVADCLARGIELITVKSLPDPGSLALFEAMGFVEQRRLMIRRTPAPKSE